MKRLRLRGDWSDTGPNARPDARTSPQPSTSESPREPENSRPNRTLQQIQLEQSLAAANLGAKNFGFFLLSFPQIERKMYQFCSVYIFCEGSVFTFQFLNDKSTIKKHNCEFYHSKIEK